MHNKKKGPHLSLKFKTIIKPENKIFIIVPNYAIRKRNIQLRRNVLSIPRFPSL